MESFIEQNFDNIDYTQNGFPEAEFDNCTFRNCLMADVNLSHRSFLECEFQDCDLTGVKLGDTAFKNVKFVGCKLMGVDFSSCNPFLLELTFEQCLMNLVSFYRLQLKETTFKSCTLEEADFAEGDLTGSEFLQCNLAMAQFDQTNLEKTDFRTAYNYSLNPNSNRLKKAKFSNEGVTGLLSAFDIIIE
ncbi:MAG: pentapeptide repeat-containing protein [Reichenbachiella sp.]|uniref:pentapeptide repeat-containing protein n=1 Tax=Reichenbachiella sp. TaxID=2184521 RepID=UPI0032651666